MPIEAVKIPQNVYVEDRIVGPLTLRQVIIVTLGGGGSYALWSSLTKAYGQLDIVTTALAWIPAVIAFAFAFIRINDLSLMRLMLLSLERMQKSSIRTWAPRAGISITIRTFTTEKKRAKNDAPALAQAKVNRLAELSSVLDSSYLEAKESPEAAAADDSPMNEPVPQESPAPAPVTPQRAPVEPTRIQVSDIPDNAASVDGVHARSSIFSTRTANA